MTARKKTTTGKGHVKKLKLKKETLRDLAPRGRKVKGGAFALATAETECQCTGNLCQTNIYTFCNCSTEGGCQTLQCMRTFWACVAK
jgi:hypothetical protein